MFLRAAAILWPGRAFARKGHLERDGALPQDGGASAKTRAVKSFRPWPAVNSPWSGLKTAVVRFKADAGAVQGDSQQGRDGLGIGGRDPPPGSLAAADRPAGRPGCARRTTPLNVQQRCDPVAQYRFDQRLFFGHNMAWVTFYCGLPALAAAGIAWACSG